MVNWFSPLVDVVVPFGVIALLILLLVLWFVREGRNGVLEQMVVKNDFGPPENFRGNMAVVEYRPEQFLRLSKSTTSARLLHFYYRWIAGVGPQAKFDDASFDKPRNMIELKKNSKCITINFSEIAAVRAREVAGKGVVSIWQLQLVPREGRPIPFAASKSGDRRLMFEQTAAVAKAASRIMGVPVHAFVAGNVWTPRWPPKITDAPS
jgi:hypothetical protein